jgi:uncharacterized delta-60 repeat protein
VPCGSEEEPGAVLLRDGSLLLAGFTSQQILVAKMLPDGNLDPTFGEAGVSTVNLSRAEGERESVEMAVDKTGRILLATRAPRGGLLVARTLADGTLDESFSDDGLATAAAGEYFSEPTAVGVLPGGRTVVVGSVGRAFTTTRIGVAVFTRAGDLDESFGRSGVTRVRSGQKGLVALSRGIDVAPDGTIFIAGYISSTRGRNRDSAAVYAISPEGALDRSFASDGIATFSRPYTPVFYSVRVRNDGKVVAAGTHGTDFMVARFRSNGRWDRGFGTNGRAINDLGQNGDHAEALAIQPDGRIVAAGVRADYGYRSFEESMVIQRYLVRPGRADADADGVKDAEDRCPATPPPAASSGDCPVFKRTVTVKYRSEVQKVRVSLNSRERRCVTGATVALFERKPGRDRRIARAVLERDNYGSVAFDVSGKPGSVYGAVNRSIEPVGLCRKARSKSISVPAGRT